MSNVKKCLASFMSPRYSLFDLLVFGAVVGSFFWYRAAHYKRDLIAAAFQSPLPSVRITPASTVPAKPYRQDYSFSTDMFTGNIPIWQSAMADYKDKPDVRYLEIGLFEGGSTMWMLENILTHSSARMTGIDIFVGPYKDKYFANLEKSGSADKVTTISESSQTALRRLPLDSFDIIYVDGSHAKDCVLEDAVLCWKLLKVDGIMIFDDYGGMGSLEDIPKVAIDNFIQCFDQKLEVIHNAFQIIVRKKKA